MPHLRLRKAGRPSGKSRGPIPSVRPTAFEGARNVQISDAHLSVVGGDVHNHYHHLSGSRVDILQVALSLVPNFRKIQQDTMAKAAPGTLAWFLKSDYLRVWRDPNGVLRIIWASGMAGAGKTVLASILINDLETRARAADGQICVAYVYIRYSDRSSVTVRALLEVLVKQIIQRHLACRSLAEDLYNLHLSEETRPTEEELLQLLQEFTKAAGTTFYIIDALDEAPTEVQLDLITKLAALDVRLFITSRPLQGVEAQFPEAHSIKLIAHDEDIDIHIAKEISKSINLRNLLETADASLREEVVALIKQKCGGMFLHASLQLNSIRECFSIHDVKQTLESFPAQIEDVYRETWKRVLDQNPKQVALAKTILLWVLHSQKPMTIEQLRRAIAVDPDTNQFDRTRLVPEATLMALCRGLVSLEEESKVVRLVHYTARDTLLSILHEPTSTHPHAIMAAVCMSHLTTCGFQDITIASRKQLEDALEADPLLGYAHDAWAFHTEKAQDQDAIMSQAKKFIFGCSSFPIMLYETRFELLGPLHMLAFYNLPISFAGSPAANEGNVRTRKEGTTALTLACYLGNHIVAQSLLDLPDILVNLPDKDGFTALMLAAYHGCSEIVKLLLQHPDIDVNLADEHKNTALILAAWGGRTEVVKLLLDHPSVDINMAGQDRDTALIVAARRGHEDIAKLLLADPNITINQANATGATALMEAVIEGRENVAALLLARPDIEVNLADEDGDTALMLACTYSDEGIIKLLITHSRVDVNLLNNRGYPALKFAARDGAAASVKLLLTHPDIDVNLRYSGGETVLMIVSCHGCEGAIPLLLSRPGIDVNLTDENGQTALMKAMREGHTGTVQLLLDHPETQVDLVDSFRNSALHWAAWRGHVDAVKLLLTRHPEVDVNRGAREGWSALALAASEGHSDTVQALLAHPETEVNVFSPYMRNILGAAAEDGHTKIVELLLTAPTIKVNAVDDYGKTAIKVAVDKGHEAIVGMLLQVSGIDITLVSKSDGHTAMSAAVAKRHHGIVRLLQEFESRRSAINVDLVTARDGQETDISVAMKSSSVRGEEPSDESDSDDSVFEDALESF